MGAVDGLPAGARAAVVTVSDRSHGGLRHDASGPLLASLLAELGFAVSDVVVVPDERVDIAAAVAAAAAGHDLVVTTGGTGLSPRDVTPEAVLPMLDRQVPGLAEALRQQNRSAVPTTILSRAVAGTVGHALVVTLPGSTGGVRDGVAVLAPVVGHAVAQLRGGDH
ncbi:MAG TPA: MogA/MoaB family molybdenum cofactor biosynthesis protein [Mycobacteriales bacterium]|nr:MogA/MoaB family molybdenum cofactor biosynthesis protein [Mycobacteriales bacterium]